MFWVGSQSVLITSEVHVRKGKVSMFCLAAAEAQSCRVNRSLTKPPRRLESFTLVTFFMNPKRRV